MSRYHNVIHIPVFPSQISKHSSLSGALALPPPEFNSPHRHRVPQNVCKTSEPPVCDPIRFDYTGQAGQGVSLADFGSRSQSVVTQVVAGTNDQVLAGTGIEEIHLRITWPGYEDLNFVQSMPASTAISRGQLGANIAVQFWSFMAQAEKSSTTNRRWKISQRSVSFKKIFLIALYSLGDGIWQTDIAIDF